ncbi:MAG TPA: sulfurtransferase, partial [Pseudomonadaceae bacterium]|nr:sulfurtransferase [Pseudomonadaceae bacterium]
MHISTLISVEELQTLLGAPHVRLFDCRFNLADPVAGRSAWQQERLPGALHADMERDLSLPHRPGRSGRHPLPERSAWVDRVGAWGILPTDLVVCYDDAGGAGAARLWWMLLWAG